MKNKKAQPVMEWIMTYGWTILVAIIAIGVLAYFGVFTPGTYDPIDRQCLAEKLCWDNDYEFHHYSSLGDKTRVSCYEINENENKLLKEFIKVNWTALDQKYVCNG